MMLAVADRRPGTIRLELYKPARHQRLFTDGCKTLPASKSWANVDGTSTSIQI
jgi:hypothetical protein